MTFLGHVVSNKGIECDSDKVAAIAEWPRPTNVSEVRTFCGLASYYRVFVENFAHIARPLHQLTQKNKPFVWTEACEGAFLELKRRLTSSPILVAPRDTGTYVLDVDASDCALGAVLQQEQDGVLRVISYGSRALSDAERRYCITRRELLGVVYGLKRYRQHLLGRPIVVRTDHAALTYLMKTPEPIGQQGRWLDLLAEYDITIQHRPGRVHGNSDALSRRPCERDGKAECRQCARPVSGRVEKSAPKVETPPGPPPCESSPPGDPPPLGAQVPQHASGPSDSTTAALSADDRSIRVQTLEVIHDPTKSVRRSALTTFVERS